MKRSLAVVQVLILVFIGSMACRMDDNLIPERTGADDKQNPLTDTTTGNRLLIKVGSSTFTATLLANATVGAFKAKLPMRIAMQELNGNEKFAQLPGELPVNALNPGTIQTGDLMLYGSNTLVLFYETFRTSYRYTKLGRIDNPSGLAAAWGSGSATVTFQLE